MDARSPDADVPGSGEPSGCYGFRLQSRLPFAYTRPADPDATPLKVVEGIDRPASTRLAQEWPEIPGKRAPTRLYARESGLLVEIGDRHWFAIGPEGSRIEVSPSPDAAHRERLLWTTPAAALIANRGDLALHASAVEIGGRAVLLTALTGGGKTTTAAALSAAGHGLLADDLACCRLDPEPVLLPGPALLRLRSDAARRLEIAGTYVAGRDPDRVTLGFEPAARRSAGPVELAGVVFLVEGSRNGVVSREMEVSEAVRLLWPQNFHLPGPGEVARSFEGLAELADRVPLWSVSRRRTWSSLPSVISEIQALVAR